MLSKILGFDGLGAEINIDENGNQILDENGFPRIFEPVWTDSALREPLLDINPPTLAGAETCNDWGAVGVDISGIVGNAQSSPGVVGVDPLEVPWTGSFNGGLGQPAISCINSTARLYCFEQ